jgi:hypothetical protein
MEVTGYVLCTDTGKFKDYRYTRFVPPAVAEDIFLDSVQIPQTFEAVKVIDYCVLVSGHPGYNAVSVVLTSNCRTKADTSLAIYSSNMAKEIEITDWLIDQIVWQIFGSHDKRIVSVKR